MMLHPAHPHGAKALLPLLLLLLLPQSAHPCVCGVARQSWVGWRVGCPAWRQGRGPPRQPGASPQQPVQLALPVACRAWLGAQLVPWGPL